MGELVGHCHACRVTEVFAPGDFLGVGTTGPSCPWRTTAQDPRRACVVSDEQPSGCTDRPADDAGLRAAPARHPHRNLRGPADRLRHFHLHRPAGDRPGRQGPQRPGAIKRPDPQNRGRRNSAVLLHHPLAANSPRTAPPRRGERARACSYHERCLPLAIEASTATFPSGDRLHLPLANRYSRRAWYVHLVQQNARAPCAAGGPDRGKQPALRAPASQPVWASGPDHSVGR